MPILCLIWTKKHGSKRVNVHVLFFRLFEGLFYSTCPFKSVDSVIVLIAYHTHCICYPYILLDFFVPMLHCDTVNVSVLLLLLLLLFLFFLFFTCA